MISCCLCQVTVCLSADSCDTDAHSVLYAVEYLNTLTPSGLPPHKLLLKVGAPVMLLRNMNGNRGQANGTIAVVRAIQRYVLEIEIVTGRWAGDIVFLPRIPMSPSEATGLPFKLRRLAFPVQLAYAMTINKAQGQTLTRMGLYLPRPVFSHGQLYVVMSRVGSRSAMQVAVVGGKEPGRQGVFTKNVVYREILD